MEPFWLGILGVVLLLALLALSVHVVVALGLVGFIGLALLTGFDSALAVLGNTMLYKTYNLQFVVIPLFVLMGTLASVGEVSRDTYSALSLWLNRVRGGLGMATVFGCTAFGTVCGSSMVTASVFAKVAVPQMRLYGYDKKLSYGLVSAAGNIGMLIPPSVLIMFYAMMANESPGSLLIAGISPGLLLLVTFCIGIWVIGRIKPALVGADHALPEVTWRQRITGIRLLAPLIVVASIVIAGVFTGFLSLTEASGGGAVVLFLYVVIFKRAFKNIGIALLDATSMTAMLLFIFISAGVFSKFLTMAGVTSVAVDWLLGLELSHTGLVIMISVIYLVMGCFLDGISMIAVTIPLVYPAVKLLGIDPIWFAMSAILAIHIGTITPPVGLNVYAVKGVAEADVGIEDIFAGVLPWFLLSLVALAFIIAFPILSTILPSMMVK